MVAQIITKEGLNHFVVIYKLKNDKFYIAYPAKCNIVLSESMSQGGKYYGNDIKITTKLCGD